MITENRIPLFYWSSKRFEGKPKENYGDLLSQYLVEKVSGKKVKWVHPRKQPWYALNKKNYLAIGSILPHATKTSIVWGSGIIDFEHHIAPADFRAVRGPETRKFLLKLGYKIPEVFGDPALLLPLFYKPQFNQKYRIGIVPHYVDHNRAQHIFGKSEEVKVIDLLTDDIEKTTAEILQCEKIISSSLHGLIVAHAYSIPAVQVKFSDKIFGNGIKYRDYFASVGLNIYEAPKVDGFHSTAELDRMFLNKNNLPGPAKLEHIQERLLKTCPFKTRNDD